MEDVAPEREFLLTLARKQMRMGAALLLFGLLYLSFRYFAASRSPSWIGLALVVGGAVQLFRGLNERSRLKRVPSNML